VKTLGDRLRELREVQDWSLREFARKLGRAAAFLSDIEHGRRYPSDDVLAEMASLLGVTVEDLKTYDSRPPVEALKRRGERDPQFGVALRRVLDQDITSEQLLKFLDATKHKDKKA
jgi:transcriptional regulator with XRE-family HTH domain